MIIAHLGIGLLILGITGSSVWQEEKITRMKIDEKIKIEKYTIVFFNYIFHSIKNIKNAIVISFANITGY